MTLEEFTASTDAEEMPPEISQSSEALQALWHCKKENWEASHNIAQDMPSQMGSWIHALLHLIEGDTGNAAYWFSMANKSNRQSNEIDALWEEIASEALSQD